MYVEGSHGETSTETEGLGRVREESLERALRVSGLGPANSTWQGRLATSAPATSELQLALARLLRSRTRTKAHLVRCLLSQALFFLETITTISMFLTRTRLGVCLCSGFTHYRISWL